MKKLFKKAGALIIIFSFGSSQFVFAQETEVPTETIPPPVPVEEVAPVLVPSEAPENTNPTEPTVETQTDTTPILTENSDLVSSEPVLQETVTLQETVPMDTLETTQNPEGTPVEASSTVDVIEQATTTDVVIEPEPESEAIVSVDVTEPTVVAEVPEAAPQEMPQEVQPVVLSVEALEPEPEFAFALTGTKIPTKKSIEHKNGRVTEEVVAQSLTTTVDNEKGEVNIGGTCADTYFVVLLFRHQEDYRNDPASYIVNRAYPCTNNTFSYSISELPASLPNGTYYILVGEQGERGAWKPITELTEITINKNL